MRKRCSYVLEFYWEILKRLVELSALYRRSISRLAIIIFIIWRRVWEWNNAMQ